MSDRARKHLLTAVRDARGRAWRYLGAKQGARAAWATVALSATALMITLAVPAGVATASPDLTPQAGAATVSSVPVLNWAPCDNGLQCATAKLPLDYRHPDGTKINIAVLKHVRLPPPRQPPRPSTPARSSSSPSFARTARTCAT